MARPPSTQQVTIRFTGPEWAPLFAYAEANGLTLNQAVRELLLTSIATNAADAVYLATARIARHRMTKIAFDAATRAMRNAWDEMRAQAAAAGYSIDDSGGS